MIGSKQLWIVVAAGCQLGNCLSRPQHQNVLALMTPLHDDSTVQQELKDAAIIPEVLDDFTPSLDLVIKWTTHHSAKLGNTLKPKDLGDPPRVKLTSTSSTDKSDVVYTIVATDPDAPSRDEPKSSEFCHWIATGLKVSSDATSPGTLLEDVVSYRAPGPPKKTGKHRYVFVAYVPANRTTEPLHLTKPAERKHWGTGKTRHGVRDWATENGLVPVGANFIYAQNKKQ